MKITISALVGVALVASVFADKSPVHWYDCSGKENGNYPHPVDCTRFVTCSNKIASERDCAVCDTHPIRCPEGRLIFDKDTNMCLFANEATCQSLCNDLRQPRNKFLRGEKLL